MGSVSKQGRFLIFTAIKFILLSTGRSFDHFGIETYMKVFFYFGGPIYLKQEIPNY